MYYFKYISIIIKIKAIQGIFLVVQCLGPSLPMQGARVPSLVRELDPTQILRVCMPQLRPGAGK